MEFVIIWILCGLIGAAIASAKEGSVAGHFLLGVLLGPLGVLITLLTAGPGGRCPHCRRKINAKASVCPHCQSRLTPAASTVTAESRGVIPGSGVILKNLDLKSDVDGHIYEARKGARVQILERRPGEVRILGERTSGWVNELLVLVDSEPHPVPLATKTCPQCTEQVQVAALICRFCRYDFGPAAGASTAATQP